MNTSSTQKDCVVDELGMIDILDPSGNVETSEVIMKLALIKLKTKHRSLNGIEKRRERTSLSKTSGGLEEASCSPINKGGDPRTSNTSLDLVDKEWIEAKAVQNLKQELVSYSIKSTS